MADLLTNEEIAHIRLCAQSYVYEPARETVGPQAINQMALRVLGLLAHIDALNATIAQRERGAWATALIWGCLNQDSTIGESTREAAHRYPDAPPAPEATP